MSAARALSSLLPRAGGSSSSSSSSSTIPHASRSTSKTLAVARPALAAGQTARANCSTHRSSSSSSTVPAYVPISPSSQHSVSSLSVSTSTSTTSETGITSTRAALALLRTQPSHYAILSLVGRTLLVRPGDIITLARLVDVQVGDVMVLDRVHELGSRDFTLRAMDPLNTRNRGEAVLKRHSRPLHGDAIQQAWDQAGATELYPGNLTLEDITSPDSSATLAGAGADANAASAVPARLVQSRSSWAARLLPSGLAHVGATLSPSTVQVRGVVLEHTKGALEKIVKFKKRKGYKKTVQHKQTLTRIRVEEFRLGAGE